MRERTDPQKQRVLRLLPSVDEVLREASARALNREAGAAHLTALARRTLDELRAELLSSDPDGEFERSALLAEATRRLARTVAGEKERGLRRVINASGVILHTNLGRAPLSDEARRRVVSEAAGYCTLEYDLSAGARGRRGARAEELLAEVTGAEAALVVNNCAAAALLVLTALARDGETLVSRGELVEIGGDFRVPDVMAQSGTRLVEVGTTNRTRLADYQQALSERTRLVMRVHPSNYRIVGFTAAPALAPLAELAHAAGIPLYEDAGSGALVDLGAYRVGDEPVVRESVAAGADIVSFSGDKLLGGPQAGLLVGRRELIERLRRAPLFRALRADKLALAALEATLEAYARDTALVEIPALRMLALGFDELEARARALLGGWQEQVPAARLSAEIIAGESAIGGGSAPLTHPPTPLIAFRPAALTIEALERRLREARPPVIARVSEGLLLIDLRTVAETEDAELLAALVKASA